ncbi:MAG: two-component regulator propeller domain-containing protein, partial [Bacteroidota bacterium]
MYRKSIFIQFVKKSISLRLILAGLIGIYCFFFPHNTFGQSELKYQNFTDYSVLSLLEDHLGFIWIGHSLGLDRFDGQHFLNYKNEAGNLESLNHNWVLALYEDKEYNLWVGTEVGLNKLDRKSGKFHRIPIIENGKEVEFQVEEIYEDETGNIWLNNREKTSFYQLDKDSEEKNKWKVIRFDLGKRLSAEYGNLVQYSLMHIQASVFWIYTNLGIVLYDNKTDKVIKLIPHPTPQLKAFQQYPKATCTPDGMLYYFMPYNFFSINTEKNDPQILALDLPKENGQQEMDWKYGLIELSYDSSGLLLFSVAEKLYSWNIAADELTTFDYVTQGEQLELGTAVTSFIKDTKGNYWVGTYLEGLYLGQPLNDAFTSHKNNPKDPLSIPKGTVVSILEDSKGDIWLSTYDNWLHKMQLKEGSIEKRTSIDLTSQPFQNIGIDQVGKIVQTADGHLVLSLLDDGLIELDSTDNFLKTYVYYSPDELSFLNNGGITDLALDGNDNIWAGSMYSGLYFIERSTRKITHFINNPEDTTSLTKGQILRLYFDRQGLLWIGTKAGLDCYDPKTGIFDHYRSDAFDPSSLSNNEVTAIYEDRKGNVWVGTIRGLNLLQKGSKKFKRYYHSDGIANSLICNIMEDDEGVLWVTTVYGVMKKLSEDSDRDFLSFNGITLSQHSHVRYRAHFNSQFSEQLYYGTDAGLLVLKPSIFGKEKVQPKMVIHSIKRYKRETGFSESITNYWLDPEKKSIKIDYSDLATTLTIADLNRFNHLNTGYEYQLKGFNKQWWPLDENLEVTLNYLPRGNYELLVRARDVNNIPIEATKLLDIQVYPPWWLSTWAYLLYFLLFAVLSYAFYSFQVKRELNQQEAENLRAIDTFKNNLFTNITHEFRTPLTIILGMMEQIEKKPEQLLKKGADLIKKNGVILLNLINQILELQKIESGIHELEMKQGDILPLLRNIFDQFQAYAYNKEQDLEFISTV